jgi:hypothetical protein
MAFISAVAATAAVGWRSYCVIINNEEVKRQKRGSL